MWFVTTSVLVVMKLVENKSFGSFNKFFKVNSVADGWSVLHEPDIVSNWKKSLRVKPKHSSAVLVPCAATKPFPEAPSHQHGYLEALRGKDVDVYVVSEPLGIVPYSWSTKYPNDSYDFPPKFLKGKNKELLIDRFRTWFDKVGRKYKNIYAALPRHHMNLIEGTEHPVVSLTISDCRADSCGDNTFRATNEDYIKFLRRKIR